MFQQSFCSPLVPQIAASPVSLTDAVDLGVGVRSASMTIARDPYHRPAPRIPWSVVDLRPVGDTYRSYQHRLHPPISSSIPEPGPE